MLDNLSRVYRSGDIKVQALKDIYLTIEAGELIVVGIDVVTVVGTDVDNDAAGCPGGVGVAGRGAEAARGLGGGVQ